MHKGIPIFLSLFVFLAFLFGGYAGSDGLQRTGKSETPFMDDVFGILKNNLGSLMLLYVSSVRQKNGQVVDFTGGYP